VEQARARAGREREAGWVYAADELYLLAGQPLPPVAYYDDWPLTENGVGAVRAFLEDVERLCDAPPDLTGRRVGIVTGSRMAEVMSSVLPRLSLATGGELVLIPVENGLFGPTVTTAGLLPGADMLDSIRMAEGRQPLDVVLLPAESLNDDDLFIDSLPFDALQNGVAGRVVAAHTLGAALASL
jgi:NifB/MoaA-like Fe-S oxidoreductase